MQCSNASVCSSYACSIQLKSPTVQYFNLQCDFIGEQNAVSSSLKLFYKRTRFTPFLIEIDMDFCDNIKNRWRSNPMTLALEPLFFTYSNVNHTCPLSGLIRVKDAPLDGQMVMGALLPAGQFRSDFRVYNTNDRNLTMLLVRLWFTVL